jgi:hypothetical protein
MFSDPVSGAVVQKQMNMPFDLLLGRNTFELWAKFWPHHTDIWPEVRTATKYIASNTITAHEWQPSVFLTEITGKNHRTQADARMPSEYPKPAILNLGANNTQPRIPTNPSCHTRHTIGP